MAKYVRPLLIGFAAGFMVAVLLAFTLGKVPGLDWFPWYGGAFVGVFTAYILSNLAGNRKVATAGEPQRQAALAFTPPAGMGLIYLYRKGFVGMAAGLNVGVDGKDVAQLKSPRFTCVAVAPGAHRVSAAFGGLAGAQNKTAEAAVTLAAGQVAAFRVGVSMGLIQNSITLTPQPDVEAVKRTLAGVQMTLPDVAAA